MKLAVAEGTFFMKSPVDNGKSKKNIFLKDTRVDTKYFLVVGPPSLSPPPLALSCLSGPPSLLNSGPTTFLTYGV